MASNKAFLLLGLLAAVVLLIASEAVARDLAETLPTSAQKTKETTLNLKDAAKEKTTTNVEDAKYGGYQGGGYQGGGYPGGGYGGNPGYGGGYPGGGYGGNPGYGGGYPGRGYGGRGGYGRGYCRFGCCYRGYNGCRRCCNYAGQQAVVQNKPHN